MITLSDPLDAGHLSQRERQETFYIQYSHSRHRYTLAVQV